MTRLHRILHGATAFALALLAGGADSPTAQVINLKPVLKNPSAIVTGNDGRIYVAEKGTDGVEGSGSVFVIEAGRPKPYAKGLDNPRGMVAFQNALFIADRQQIRRIDRQGKVTVYAPASKFDQPPKNLTHLAVDEGGKIYAADQSGVVYQVERPERGGKAKVVIDAAKTPQLKQPGNLVLDGQSFLIVRDLQSNNLLRVNLSNGTATLVAEGLGSGQGLAWDYFGRLFVAGGVNSKLSVIPRTGQKPVAIPAATHETDDLCLAPGADKILQLSSAAGQIHTLADQVPGQEVDVTPLAVRPVVAFPNLQWTGWQAEDDNGRPYPLRPILLTHAGDGSNRLFVPSQQGVIHVFPNDPKVSKTKIFLDLQSKVKYSDNTNEEGFLGLAFHPDYKKNGEFFVFYTLQQPQLTNVVVRYRVSKDDPNQADPDSAEEILRIKKPFWNHDGGTLCFGPDGYLYIALGDGGLANDPNNNGQNLNSILGKILRIDINSKENGKNYAIPKDNPFAGKSNARPEIFAYGIRNVWRMSFDPKTGWLWAGDVGQNLYEEVDLIVKGGNYGWRKREGLHPFSSTGVSANGEMVDPIWEYHHDIGKSITGGNVYRGKLVPELDGMYLSGDYVSGKIWALKYDEAQKRVVANHPIPSPPYAILSFGQDQAGEVYFMTVSNSGKDIYRLERSTAPRKTPSISAPPIQ
jgi:glucose/arabinose dehydrogenase